jgi:DNA invertase Pin-like site-specific DNA recombinase
LDRAGRSLAHLIALVTELQERGIGFASLNEGVDFSTASGKLQFALLAALAEFERDRLKERVHAGLARARAQGTRLGRPRKLPAAIEVPGGSVRSAARVWGVAPSTAARYITAGRRPHGAI